MKLKKGDEIKVIIGKDKGKTGKIEKVLTQKNMVLVPGINEYKRHVRGTTKGQKSEIATITKPMALGKIQLVCPKCHEITRIGYEIVDKKKVRICRKCDQQI